MLETVLGTAGGFALLAVGVFICLAVMPGLGKGGWLVERIAAVIVVAGGYVGLSGLVGQWFERGFAWVVDFINRHSERLVGEGTVGLVGLGLAVVWVLGFLPKFIHKRDMPDWLIFAGFVIPALLTFSSGSLADFFQGIFELIGAGNVG